MNRRPCVTPSLCAPPSLFFSFFLARFTSIANDLVAATGSGYTVRVKKEAEVWQLLATLEDELGVPMDRTRLWTLEARQNNTKRPMGCVLPEHLNQGVAALHTSSGGRCMFYMEVLTRTRAIAINLSPGAAFLCISSSFYFLLSSARRARVGLVPLPRVFFLFLNHKRTGAARGGPAAGRRRVLHGAAALSRPSL